MHVRGTTRIVSCNFIILNDFPREKERERDLKQYITSFLILDDP